MDLALDHFNAIARYYDWLKGIVFGNAIYKSQLCFLDYIPPGGNVLILGGGSGELLVPLREMNPSCRIWYVEASSEMLLMASEKAGQPVDGIEFIHGTEKHIPEKIVFDAVITNFFLDVFPAVDLPSVRSRVIRRMAIGSVWLVSDFSDSGKWWHRILLWIMYRFFRLFCQIEATVLPPWERFLEAGDLHPVVSQSFYGDFIKSVVYRCENETPAIDNPSV